jgi:hypothetical protein
MTDQDKREALERLEKPDDDSPGYVVVLQLKHSLLIRVAKLEDEAALDAMGARAFFYE